MRENVEFLFDDDAVGINLCPDIEDVGNGNIEIGLQRSRNYQVSGCTVDLTNPTVY